MDNHNYKQKYNRLLMLFYFFAYFAVFLTFQLIFHDQSKTAAILSALAFSVCVTLVQYYVMKRRRNNPKELK